MILVDNNGNTFTSANTPTEQWLSLKCPYVLWFEPARLSVNLKYVLPIRILTPVKVNSVKILLDHSRTFTCVPPQILQDSDGNLRSNLEINWGKSWYDYILTEEQKKMRQEDEEGNIFTPQTDTEGKPMDKTDPDYIWFLVSNQEMFLHGNDTIVVNENPLIDFPFYILKLEVYRKLDEQDNYFWCFPMCLGRATEPTHLLWTFYLIACNGYEETVLKNIKITAFEENGQIYDETVIQVGATFYDESEELRINASNQGIKLPADICKAFWNCGFHEYYADRQEQREKLKELLFNYMGIRGECGNYASAQKALKWFGWGEKVQLSQLLVLNQNLQNMYLNDYFDIFSDMPRTFKYLRTTTLLSLKSHIRVAAGLGKELESPQEGTYKLKNLSDEPLSNTPYEDSLEWISNPEIFGKNIKFTGTAQDNLTSYQAEYNYVMGELALKLACMASIYERYLLPVQLNVVSSSVVEHVSSAPLKYLSGTFAHVMESVDNITSDNIIFDIIQKNYVIQTSGSRAYVDFTYQILLIPLEIVDPNTEKTTVYLPESLSYKIFLSIKDSSKERGKLLWHSDLVIEDFNGLSKAKDFNGKIIENAYRVTTRVYTTDLDDTITKASHLSILCDGKWTQASVKITYPDFALQTGVLEYVYNLQDAPTPQNIFNIHEPDLVMSQVAERYESENTLLTNPSDYWEDENISDVTEYVHSSINIPSAHKNLVITLGLANILDEMYCFSDMDFDSYTTLVVNFAPTGGASLVYPLLRQVVKYDNYKISTADPKVDYGLFSNILHFYRETWNGTLNADTDDLLVVGYRKLEENKQSITGGLNTLLSTNNTTDNPYIFYENAVFGSANQNIELNYYKYLYSGTIAHNNYFFRVKIDSFPFISADSLYVSPTFMNLYIKDFEQLEVWISRDNKLKLCLGIIRPDAKSQLKFNQIITVCIKDIYNKQLKKNPEDAIEIIGIHEGTGPAKFYGVEFLTDDLVVSGEVKGSDNILTTIDSFTYTEDKPVKTDSQIFNKLYFMFCEYDYNIDNIKSKTVSLRPGFSFKITPKDTPYQLLTYAQPKEYVASAANTIQVIFKKCIVNEAEPNKTEETPLATYLTSYDDSLSYCVPYIVPAGANLVEIRLLDKENYQNFMFGAITYKVPSYAMFPRQISPKDQKLSLNNSSDIIQFFDSYVMINQYQEYFNLLYNIIRTLLQFENSNDELEKLLNYAEEITFGYTQRIKKPLEDYLDVITGLNPTESLDIDTIYDTFNSDEVSKSWNTFLRSWLQEVTQLVHSGNIVLGMTKDETTTTESLAVLDELTQFKLLGQALYPRCLYTTIPAYPAEPAEYTVNDKLKDLETYFNTFYGQIPPLSVYTEPLLWSAYLFTNVKEGNIMAVEDLVLVGDGYYKIPDLSQGAAFNAQIEEILNDYIPQSNEPYISLKNTLKTNYIINDAKYPTNPENITFTPDDKINLLYYYNQRLENLKILIYQGLLKIEQKAEDDYQKATKVYRKKLEILTGQEENPQKLRDILNSFKNYAPKYYLLMISKYPLNKLFGSKYLLKYPEIGLTSFLENEINDWKQKQLKMDYTLFGYHSNVLQETDPVEDADNTWKKSSAQKSLIFMVNRFKFKPMSEDINGYTVNTFFKDDLIVCRVLNSKFSAPFYGYSHGTQSLEVKKYGRYEISRKVLSATGSLTETLKVQCIQNYLIFDKDVLQYYLNPGYYSITFRYAIDKYKNYEKKFDNFIFIQNKINSMLYNDKY